MARVAKGDDNASLPRHLKLAWRIEQYGSPNGQGWGAWPAGTIERMNVALNVYNAVQMYHEQPNDKKTKWLADHPRQAKIIGKVMEAEINASS